MNDMSKSFICTNLGGSRRSKQLLSKHNSQPHLGWTEKYRHSHSGRSKHSWGFEEVHLDDKGQAVVYKDCYSIPGWEEDHSQRYYNCCKVHCSKCLKEYIWVAIRITHQIIIKKASYFFQTHTNELRNQPILNNLGRITIYQIMNITRKLILGTFAAAFTYSSSEQKENCFIYRDDIGAYWGIKGYEEMVTEVGTHHGHLSWPQFRTWGTYDSGSVRRGFQVFTKNCANCHGMMGKKYDLLLDKVYEQIQLSTWVAEHFTIHPAHHHYKQFYYQEWDERDRYIHDHIYAPYFSQDQAKNANGGVWPTDFTKIRLRPGGINYIYNIMTGYHFKPPYGLEVPKGKYFNPYFDHMIIGMPRQLKDGMLEFEDGTPASTPQMANDVSNFIFFMQRRSGWRRSDKKVRELMVFFGILLLMPIKYLKTQAYFRSLLCTRTEVYAVRDSLGYKHWKTGMKSMKAPHYRGAYWT